MLVGGQDKKAHPGTVRFLYDNELALLSVPPDIAENAKELLEGNHRVKSDIKF